MSRAAGKLAVIIFLPLGVIAGAGDRAGISGSESQEQQSPAPTHPRTDRHGDPLPLHAIARLGTIRFRHGRFVLDLACSPDGKMVALSGQGGLGLWDAETGKPIRRLSTRGTIRRVSFSTDGKLLAAVGDPSAIWETATGKVVRELQSAYEDLAFAPDGKHIAIAQDKFIRLEEVAGGVETRRFQADSNVTGIAFSPDGKWLTAADAYKVPRR